MWNLLKILVDFGNESQTLYQYINFEHRDIIKGLFCDHMEVSSKVNISEVLVSLASSYNAAMIEEVIYFEKCLSIFTVLMLTQIR